MGTVSTAAAAAGGIVAATLASLLVSPAIALGIGIAVTAGGSVALGDGADPLVGGLACSAALGALTLLPVLPPSYPAAIGSAFVAAAALGLAAAELGIRAGTIVDAKSIGKTDYGRAWLLPTAVLAIGLLCWRLGAGGRVVLGGVVALVAGTHFAVVHLGAPVLHQAITLVPLALVAFVALPLASDTDYVAPGTEPSPLRRGIERLRDRRADDAATDEHSGTPADGAQAADDRHEVEKLFAADGADAADGAVSEAGTAADDPPADDGADAPQPGPASGDPSPEPADAVEAASDVATANAGGASAAVAGADTETESEHPPSEPVDHSVADGGAGASASGASASTASPTASQESVADAPGAPAAGQQTVHEESPADGNEEHSTTGDEETATTAGDATATSAGEEPDHCQNCGSAAPTCAPRVVIADADCTVSLCERCHEARADAIASIDQCRSQGLPVDVAATYRCQGCGDGGELEAHPVVPLDDGGHRHPNNVFALCPDCHAAVEAHRAASD